MKRENNINEIRSESKWILPYILVVMFCYILPVLKYSISYIPLSILLLVTYLMCINDHKIDIDPYVKIIFYAGIMGLLMAIVCQPGNITEGINEIIRALRFVCPAILYLFIEGNGKPNTFYMKVIEVAAFVLFIFVALNTMKAVQSNPMIARMLAYGTLTEDLSAYRFENVGGFEFSYALGFMAVVAVYMVFASKKIIPRLCWIGFLVLAIYYVVSVQYMTLLILTVVFSVIVVYTFTKHTPMTLLVTLAVVIAIVMIPSLVIYLSENASGTMMQYKFGNFASFFADGDLSDLGNRPRYLAEAFLRFLKSPIWGNTIVSGGSIISEYNEVHSTFFGYLQNMGLIGWGSFYGALFLMYKRIRETFEIKMNQQIYTVIFSMLVALSILNPINYAFEICFSVFLIVPCILKLLDYQEAEESRDRMYDLDSLP